MFTAAAGILPAGLAALFVLALPHLMRFLSHWQGALSRGQMDQDVIKQMFLFMLVRILDTAPLPYGTLSVRKLTGSWIRHGPGKLRYSLHRYQNLWFFRSSV